MLRERPSKAGYCLFQRRGTVNLTDVVRNSFVKYRRPGCFGSPQLERLQEASHVSWFRFLAPMDGWFYATGQ